MRTFSVTDSNTTLHFSKLMFGTTYLGYEQPEQAYSQLDTYYKLGGRTIDTARVYSLFQPEDKRSAECAVGEWLTRTGLRKEMLISTKGGHPKMGQMNTSRLSKQDLEQDLHLSLQDLQTDMVDIYWLHRDDQTLPVGAMMETLHGFVQQGHVRMLGASNWTHQRILEANAYAEAHGLTKFAASQIQWSYAFATPKDMNDETLVCMNQEVYAAYQQAGLSVFAYESQAKGLFSKLRDMPEEELPVKVRERFLNPTNRALNLAKADCVNALCDQYNVSPAVISLAYILNNPLNAGAIIGCSKLSQLEDSMQAGDFCLSAEDIAYLNTVLG